MTRNREWSPRPYSLTLRSDHDLFYDKLGRFWIFDKEKNIWTEQAYKILDKEIREWHLNPEELDSYHVREIINDVKSLSFEEAVMRDPRVSLLPFANTIYDLRDNKCIDYSGDYFFTSKLPVNYNPNATCPEIDRIFKQLVPEDRVIDLYELVAYCLVRNYKYQKIFFLYGSGANGKSVYTSILERILGENNISSASLTSLQYNRFTGAELYHKLANICSELRYEEMKNLDLIKKLSGGDMILAERKGKDPFQFKNFAKLIFVTNSLPSTLDKTYAFYRRLFLIEFPNTFAGSKQDRDLLSKIDPCEYEGLAFKCIDVILSLKERGFAFTNQPDPKNSAEEYEKLSNPLDTFFKEKCDYDENEKIAKSDFREMLTKWAKEKGFRVPTDPEINGEMKIKGIDTHKNTFSGQRQNAWGGIKWKEE